MSNRYNTQGKRIREINNVMDNIRSNNTAENNIINQGSSILATLIDPDGDDAVTKDGLLQCSNQIYFSLNEILKVDSRYYMKDPYISRWIKPITINLLNYVPGCIKEIKDSNGQVLNNNITDLYCCFALFCKYNEKPYLSGNDHTSTSYRSNNFFKKNNDFYHIDLERKEKYNKYKSEADDVERKIRDAENQIEAQRERVRQARERARKNRNPWRFITNMINDYKARKEQENLNSMINHFDLGQKWAYLSELRRKMAENNPMVYGCYYDDGYLMQRVVQKTKKKKISIVTGVNVSKGAWGKINTEERREDILQDYQEDPVNTSYYPEIPNPNEFKGFINKDWRFRNNNCLASNIESVRNLASMRFEPDPEDLDKYYDYLKQLNKSENNVNEPSYVIDPSGENSYAYASYVADILPKVLYYKSKKDNTFMLLETEPEIIASNPKIKSIYKSRYDESEEIVKYFVYDEESFGKYYKDFDYKVKVSFKLLSSNLTDKNEDIFPTLCMSDEAFIASCKSLKNKLQKIIKELKDLYIDNIKKSYYCEDYEPLKHYSDFYSYLSNFTITSVDQCDDLVDYCLDVIKPWYINRTTALYNSITDTNNTERYYKLLRKRLKKNSSPLLIWYQSLVSFDNSYDDYLLTKKIIEDTVKDILVTTGNSKYHEDSFNLIKNCNYIDIEEPDKIYNGKRFNIGDTVYIIKGMAKEQINRISRIETIYVEVTDGESIDKIPVTRLYLDYKLKDWCNDEDPTKIMIAKLL